MAEFRALVLREAGEGKVEAHHRFMLEIQLSRVEAIEANIAAIDAKVQNRPDGSDVAPNGSADLRSSWRERSRSGSSSSPVAAISLAIVREARSDPPPGAACTMNVRSLLG